ncbi:MAG: nucleotidyltransferase domain-containing protein [Lachnospiraceae bacterium]|nr:nucleotidyltransferase domain-containing protein [Lachnospiraceae bacterium]
MDKDRQRLMKLLDLQEKLVNSFGESDYNVFIFGSYITHSYVEGRSDIDIAIYSDDFKKYLQVSVFIEDYFNKLGIKQDIFYINTLIPAPIYCAALESPVCLTDYYPETLKTFYHSCKNMQMAMREETA